MMEKRFSLLALERKLSALPWVLTFGIWVVICGVLLLLYLLKPTEEWAQVVSWMIPLSFLVVVPGLGGFVSLLMRTRRSRMDTTLLAEMQTLLGGELHGPSLLLPVVRPRLLTSRAGVPVEIVLSPPIPRTSVQAAVDPQQAVAYQTIERIERALESPDARLGTATWPQLELRLGADLPCKLQVSTRGPGPCAAPGLDEIAVDDPAFAERLRTFSDSPEVAAGLLGRHDLRTKLLTAATFNHPWATQLTLRPAHSGRGAGIYLVTVAGPETNAEILASTIEQLLEIAHHPAWSGCTAS